MSNFLEDPLLRSIDDMRKKKKQNMSVAPDRNLALAPSNVELTSQEVAIPTVQTTAPIAARKQVASKKLAGPKGAKSQGSSNVGKTAAYAKAAQSVLGGGQAGGSTSASGGAASGALSGAMLGAQTGTGGAGIAVGAAVGGTMGVLKARSNRKKQAAKAESEHQSRLANIHGQTADKKQKALQSIMSGLRSAFIR